VRSSSLLFIDSDIAIGIIYEKVDFEILKARLENDDQIAITSLSMYELYFGLYLVEIRKKGKVQKELIERERKAIEKLKEECIQVPFTDIAADRGVKIFHDLANKGQEIKEYDYMIAGTVLTKKDGSLLTNNINNFNQIEGFPLVAFDTKVPNDP